MEPIQTLITALAALAGTAILTLAMFRGWQGWLDLRAREIDAARPAAPPPDTGTSVGGRIELADLRERVRRLEAIAAGVDL